ncbi:hypothetical protein Y032_0272g931 [Ancylostoma ceylanicum]|uniref:Uncharacterized protein n=1 Tax=Ancylostoma ceylanicum TaxID=53326 RepID=A0A016S915_9BILA|nr:hypothetical protein Y032_0272g931 [Ancylostoma ceylanicum]
MLITAILSILYRNFIFNDIDAPRAKRRFERVSAQFERFRISEGADDSGRIEMEKGALPDDYDWRIRSASAPTCLNSYGVDLVIYGVVARVVVGCHFTAPRMDTDSEEEDDFRKDTVDDASNEGVVEEPDDVSNGFQLGDYLKDYLERMKQENILPSRNTIKGNELAIWRPLSEFRDPFEDPTMKGRIQEVEGDETPSSEGYVVHHVSESGDSESENEMPSHAISTPKVRIEELTDQSGDTEGMECD